MVYHEGLGPDHPEVADCMDKASVCVSEQRWTPDVSTNVHNFVTAVIMWGYTRTVQYCDLNPPQRLVPLGN